jgi:hypothetical protein
VTDSGKHSSLSQYGKNYFRQKFYSESRIRIIA